MPIHVPQVPWQRTRVVFREFVEVEIPMAKDTLRQKLGRHGIAGCDRPAIGEIDGQRDAEYYEGAVIACEFAKRGALQAKAYEQQNQ